jgi:retinol dehydrogenase-12
LTHNAKVYVASRSQEKAEVAIKDLKDSTGKEALFLKLDLADLKSVKASAEEYLRFVCPVDSQRHRGFF